MFLPQSADRQHEYPALVVMQPTTFCNINCSYCWLPNRDMNARMPIAVAHRTIEFFVSNAPPGASIVFLWHSGEPTSVGLKYFERLIEVKTHRPDVRVRHRIQTNATLLDRAWCDLLCTRGIDVGVSLDGPQHVHDRHRVGRSGAGSFDKALRGIKLLQEYGIRVSNLAVISDYSLDYPEEIYDFFQDNGLNIIGYSVEQIEGIHKSSRLFNRIQADSTARYVDFLTRLYSRWRRDQFGPIIREFDWAITQVLNLLRAPRYAAVSDQTIPLRIIAVTNDGSLVTFSPELITGTAEDTQKFVIGNVLALRSFSDLVNSEALAGLMRDVEAGTRKCKAECAHYAVCGGGSVSSKYFETGSVAAAETAYCRAHKKIMFDCISNLLTDDDLRMYSVARSASKAGTAPSVRTRSAQYDIAPI